MKYLVIIAALAGGIVTSLLPVPGHTAPPVLTVYTYASFVSEWGPGPAIEKAFAAECGCELRFVGLEDGAALLSRLKLEGDKSTADVILGLDTSLTAEAQATGLLATHGIDTTAVDLTLPWSDPVFVPYDYGYFAFVYDSEALSAPPASLQALVADKNGPEIIIQDPRTSTPGLGLLLWLRQVFGEGDSDAWRALAPRIVTVTKGWSEAYGLFLEGEAPLVLSYTTSPAYHRHVEQTDRYRAAMFSEGHYQQVEVAARLAGSKQPRLAQQFLEFLLSPAVQDILPTSNWMLPAVNTGTPLPAAFSGEEVPDKALRFDSATVRNHRKQWISRWLQALTD